MSRRSRRRTFVCDFETTVYEGQTFTEVWASACVEIGTEDVRVVSSIGEQFDYFASLGCDVVAYYHNLKFDGSFWLSYLICCLGFEQAVGPEGWADAKDIRNGQLTYCISDMGQWYTVRWKYRGHVVELRDSAKLLPFSVRAIGEAFKTKHSKLDMEYEGYRYAGCEITPEEREYIANDVLVVKEALEVMFADGHDKLTIGSCCMEEFKSTLSRQDYKDMFPSLADLPCPVEGGIYKSADEYIRKSYKGGWCYCVPGKTNRLLSQGTTADVNSLYPSMMHSQSGNRYPIGEPEWWDGDMIPDEALGEDRFFFIHVRTRFYIKPGMLPCIQMKGDWRYRQTEWLESSDVAGSAKYVSLDGTVHDARVDLWLSQADYELIVEHYDLPDFEVVSGCWFFAMAGIFDRYIDKWAEVKKTSKGALRQEAKLFLNNLYGKMASSDVSSYKLAFVKEDGTLGFTDVEEHNKVAGHIAVGAAITSYARCFTIRAAQANYHGPDKPGFCYADTDSIHCDLPPEEVKAITVHPVDFCCWKLESCWDRAVFVRQKTYMEHITHEDLEPVEPTWDVKCAGMPETCKRLVRARLGTEEDRERESLGASEDAKRFLAQGCMGPLEFGVGLRVPGKLLPKRIPGGVVLKDTWFEMR